MQPAYIVPAAEWDSLTARLARLEAAETARLATTAEDDAHANEVLTVRQAAAHIGLTPEQLRRARRAGKLQGVRLNEKDFGYRRRDLDAYPRRYHRATQAA
ncbi:DNA-binding protein [Hymenobacter sp. UV11]|uniref:DNA-binding protein n=1 Tax=Hymenobacter sp. UV11 TaxID=1849735 RepID=UPI00105DEFCA|nr:DNA-binding protein [Hymenobacter sp. UV11]TDN39295.1 hypothetical protein A8B98_18725 [Hymenobacter sp. UV11]TFZ65625.1 DNA-binding protein [Hymenobacter sp. UV11]